jgi:hypothetical protein
MNWARRIAALALLVAAWPAGATLIECRSPGQTPFVVFLSEPRFTPEAFASRDRMIAFFNRLQEHLDQRRDLEMADLATAPFRVARCEGRLPELDGQDFTREVVRSLYNRSVVIEIWGELDVARGPGGRLAPTAQMNYLIMPIRKAADDSALDVPGLHRFRYPDAEIVATDFLDLVSNGDLHAFVAAGIGVMAFDGSDHVKAHQFLCNAVPRLQRIEQRLAQRPESRAQGQSLQRLRLHLLGLAAQSVARLRTSPSGGLAQLQSESQPCGGEVTR